MTGQPVGKEDGEDAVWGTTSDSQWTGKTSFQRKVGGLGVTEGGGVG